VITFDAAGRSLPEQFLLHDERRFGLPGDLVDGARERCQLVRVVRASGPLVITFSNRCFPTKVIAAWLSVDDAGHAALVEAFLVEAGSWTAIERQDRSPAAGDPLFALIARSAGASRP